MISAPKKSFFFCFFIHKSFIVLSLFFVECIILNGVVYLFIFFLLSSDIAWSLTKKKQQVLLVAAGSLWNKMGMMPVWTYLAEEIAAYSTHLVQVGIESS